ncbi:strawberry notch C-terminal domain-containing protein [Nostoc sp. PA-18-2419]|nr:strawberry notch C-terminal domain-containing protein [Nostoc sp. PA-18-2419]
MQVTTNVRDGRRFISTITRRLDSLGALTRGQRQTGGNGIFETKHLFTD